MFKAPWNLWEQTPDKYSLIYSKPRREAKLSYIFQKNLDCSLGHLGNFIWY